MRSTFAGLNTMLSGIQTYSLGLDTVGHNITNANTDGYSRQSVDVAATPASKVYTSFGPTYVGNGAGALSINRARDAYADKQYWRETSAKGYYETQQKNYAKIEEIFNDTDNIGLQSAISRFYKSWLELSTNASDSAYQTSVVESGNILAGKVELNTTQVQNQILAEYQDLALNVDKVNMITDSIVGLNKSILTMEATGANANDLRDQRDLLVDDLSRYMNINVYEDGQGMYTIVSNGTSIVNGITGLHLQLGNRIDNEEYGVTDYTLQIKETGTTFDGLEGILKGNIDNVTVCKNHIDALANISAFMLTTLNAQHKAGQYETSSGAYEWGGNFFGAENTKYTWDTTSSGRPGLCVNGDTANLLRGVKITSLLKVSPELTAINGYTHVAANLPYDSTGDGANAVIISTLFNTSKNDIITQQEKMIEKYPEWKEWLEVPRSIGDGSLNDYYITVMTDLGIQSEVTNDNLDYEEAILEQIRNWRESTSGVNWNEELTYMITFQTGYSACSRCLTTMDEMLDRLINSTGVVGR